MVIKQTPVLVHTAIPCIMKEHELMPIPSKITVLKAIITINTLSRHLYSIDTSRLYLFNSRRSNRTTVTSSGFSSCSCPYHLIISSSRYSFVVGITTILLSWKIWIVWIMSHLVASKALDVTVILTGILWPVSFLCGQGYSITFCWLFWYWCWYPLYTW